MVDVIQILLEDDVSNVQIVCIYSDYSLDLA
jgi:hypothetical protein